MSSTYPSLDGDGSCRDVDRALKVKYPIFSRGSWMRTGKDRVRVEAILGAAREIHEAGAHIRSFIEQGRDLRSAREAYGYHRLQSKH